MTEVARPQQEKRFAVIEISVKPETFKVKLIREEWDAMSHEERETFCKEMANEFGKLKFGYVFMERST